MELRSRTLPVVNNDSLPMPKRSKKHIDLELEPYIAVVKDPLININKIDPSRIKEIVYCHWNNKIVSSYLCYKYPATEHGYRKTREIIEEAIGKKCSKIEINSFNAACDMASYDYKVEYCQYIQRFINGDREDLEDLADVCNIEYYFYNDKDHFHESNEYLIICTYD